MRRARASQGVEIRHADALEAVARSFGYRDWNGFHAALQNHGIAGWAVGGRVTGRYLSQPFRATIRSAEPLRPGWVRLILDLDTPVDVVTFESFSNLRRQLRANVGPGGYTKECTSDGVPHLQLDL